MHALEKSGRILSLIFMGVDDDGDEISQKVFYLTLTIQAEFHHLFTVSGLSSVL